MDPGKGPSFLNRRSRDSEAHRYCVGLSPILEKARRHAWISGNSASVPVASRAWATAVNFAIRESAAPSGVIPAAATVPATSSGYSDRIASEC
nr:hypothetical protein GCM10020093_057500 [Planobispora longispora]